MLVTLESVSTELSGIHGALLLQLIEICHTIKITCGDF
jgi:hypothetical protein